MKLICAVVMSALLSGFLVCSQSAQAGAANSPASQFVMGPRAALMPQGYFLLIRKGRKIGAIRFTAIEPGSISGIGKASYESYFQGDGSGSFQSQKARRRNGKINVKPLKGIYPFSFQLGNDKIKVGGWMFVGAPGLVEMWPYRGEEKDYGYEFAPTSAQSVGEINASDKRLKWFRYNADTKVVMQVSELPK